MPVKTKLHYKCDLCGAGKHYETKQNAEKAGWVELSIPNYHLDRDWFEKLVCPECTKMISTKLNVSMSCKVTP